MLCFLVLKYVVSVKNLLGEVLIESYKFQLNHHGDVKHIAKDGIF